MRRLADTIIAVCSVFSIANHATVEASERVRLDGFTFERVSVDDLRSGGLFVSEFPEIEDILNVPPPEIRKLYLFADGLAICVSEDNIKDEHPREIGIWKIAQRQILFFYGSPVTLHRPAERFEAWRVKRDGVTGSLILSKAGVVNRSKSALDVFLDSVALVRTPKEDEERELIARLLHVAEVRSR